MKRTWLTPGEAARELGRTVSALRYYAQIGELNPLRTVIGGKSVTRYDRIEVEELSEQLGPKRRQLKVTRHVTSQGYVSVTAPEGHPRAMSDGRVYEHWLVAEEKLGRFLKPGEQVHHVNGVRDDNRPENLQVFKDRGEHMRKEHNLLKRYLKGGAYVESE